MDSNTPYIFGIGAGKTGSHSLAFALKKMGFRTHHTGHENYEGNKDVWNKLTFNQYHGRHPLEGITGLDCLVDHPVWEMFKEIDQHVETAKFILTYRPPSDCALSWCRMIADKHTQFKDDPVNEYKLYEDKVRNHVDSVLTHFFGRPQKLLVLDARDPDQFKWKLLQQFLGKPAPINQPYPHRFNHKDWQT